MYLKTFKVNQANKEESVAAKEYWKLEDSHSATYKQPAHYTDVILQFIKLSSAKKILEFGCGSGRNLNQINDFFEKQALEENFYLLKGIDINQHLIEYGKTNFSKNLELIVADENFIKKEKNNFYDLIFTVSVLDHLPDPTLTIQQLIKKTKRYIIFIEPFNPDIKQSEKIENISTIWKKNKLGNQATPYTYFHNYKSYFKQNKLDIVCELPLPTHLGKIGPFYKLFLVQKVKSKKHIFDAHLLIEQLQKTAILTNVKNATSSLAKLNKSLSELKQQQEQNTQQHQTIDHLNQQVKSKEEKIDQIDQQLQQSKQQYEAQLEKINEFNQDLINKQQEIHQLSSHLKQQQEQNTQQHQTIDHLNQQVKSKEEKIDQIDQQLQQSKQQYEAQLEKINEFNQDLINKQQEIHQLSSHLKQQQEQNTQQHQTIDHLNQQVKSKEEKIDQIDQQLQQSKQQYEAQLEKINEFNQDLINKQQEIHQLSSHLKQQQEQNTQQHQTIDHLNQQVKSKEEKIDQIDQQLQQSKQQYEAQLEKINEFNQDLINKQQEIHQLNSVNSKFSHLIKTELSNTYNNKLGDLFLKGTKSISAFIKLPYEIYKFRNNIKQKVPKILGDKTFDLFVKNFCNKNLEEISKFLNELDTSSKIKSDACTALSKYFRSKKDFNKHVQFADLAYKTDPKLYRRKFLMFAHAKNQDYQNFNFLLLTLDKDRDFTEFEQKEILIISKNLYKKEVDNYKVNQNTKKIIYPDFEILKKNFDKPKLTVATIMDEFSLECLSYEWNLIILKKDEWLRQIKDLKPDFLFVESAWRGNHGQWNGALTRFSNEHSNKLYDLIKYCRKNKIPTVFWNKEDPSNFSSFINAAKEFDYIFTTDQECIDNYVKICGHTNVYCLPFAAQPILHNPAGRQNLFISQVAFAGAWYEHKHINRKKYLTSLLDAAVDLGINFSIFDRFSDLNLKDSVNHKYPTKYIKYIRPKLSYSKMLSVYRMFPVFLNVNSVEKSPTMFSRRVFELLACGTNIVSSPAKGIDLLFPKIVGVAISKNASRFLLDKFINDKIFANSNAHLGYREIMCNHTYKIRSEQIISKVLPNFKIITKKPRIAVIATTNRPERLENILKNYICQNYENKNLIIVLNSKKFIRDKVEETILKYNLNNFKIFNIPENITLGGCINHVVDFIDCDYWAKFDDDDIYGENYLKDSLLPFAYTDAGIVGKKTYICKIKNETKLFLRQQGHTHTYTNRVCGGTFVIDMKIMKKISFDDSVAKGGDTIFLNKAKLAGIKIYSADYYNFVQVRGENPSEHTWTINKEKYLEKCQELEDSFNSFI